MHDLTADDFDEPYQSGNRVWRAIAHPAPRIRVSIVQDTDSVDPFDDGDGHWPMVAHHSRLDPDAVTHIDIGPELTMLSMTSSMQRWFTDEGLVHDQREIFRLLDVDMNVIEGDHGTRRLSDPDLIRDIVVGYEPEEKDLVTRAALFELAGVPVMVRSVHGRVQSSWADLLMIAPRETCEKFGLDYDDREEIERQFTHQAELYQDWMRGDVYGFTIEMLPEALSDPEDAIEEGWEDVADGSCWGLFGDWKTLALDEVNSFLRGDQQLREMIEAHQAQGASDNLTATA